MTNLMLTKSPPLKYLFTHTPHTNCPGAKQRNKPDSAAPSRTATAANNITPRKLLRALGERIHRYKGCCRCTLFLKSDAISSSASAARFMSPIHLVNRARRFPTPPPPTNRTFSSRFIRAARGKNLNGRPKSARRNIMQKVGQLKVWLPTPVAPSLCFNCFRRVKGALGVCIKQSIS